MSLLAADAAGILLGDARDQLRAVAASSDDAQSLGLDINTAFERQRRYCRDNNVRLSDAARQITQGRFGATIPAPASYDETSRETDPSRGPY